MFRRIRWIVLGAAVGVAVYLWAGGKARDAKEAVPEGSQELVRQARETASELGERLREAVREGRQAMIEKEDELRKEMLGNGSGER